MTLSLDQLQVASFETAAQPAGSGTPYTAPVPDCHSFLCFPTAPIPNCYPPPTVDTVQPTVIGTVGSSD